jgi:hypothetical protein
MFVCVYMYTHACLMFRTLYVYVYMYIYIYICIYIHTYNYIAISFRLRRLRDWLLFDQFQSGWRGKWIPEQTQKRHASVSMCKPHKVILSRNRSVCVCKHGVFARYPGTDICTGLPGWITRVCFGIPGHGFLHRASCSKQWLCATVGKAYPLWLKVGGSMHNLTSVGKHQAVARSCNREISVILSVYGQAFHMAWTSTQKASKLFWCFYVLTSICKSQDAVCYKITQFFWSFV